MPSPSSPDPGRTVRIVCNWVVGLLVAATLLHLLTLPKEDDGEADETAAESSHVWQRSVPLTRVAQSEVATNPLDAGRAMGYLRAICEIGPRISGTEGMRLQQKLVQDHFEPLADELEFQRFAVPHPKRRSQRVPMANVIARWRPAAPDRLLLCAHYDTRPLPDQDPDRRKRRTGVFIGANDGGSGVAVLMELAHLMHDRFDAEATDPNVGVDFVLFDGEELVYPDDRNPKYFWGSQQFGLEYAKRRPLPATLDREATEWSYKAAVLLDMVADADLQVYWERHSFEWRQSRPIAREVWEVAEELGVEEFIPRVKHTVLDDHLALRKFGGIRAIDVIDFDYPYWHTTEDTVDKCSGESMAKVGWVAWEWLLDRASGGP
ncbi:MAG: M28 family peptidase [Planctomycetota bacterium]